MALKQPFLTRIVDDPDGMGTTFPGSVRLDMYPWLEPYCIERPNDGKDRDNIIKQGNLQDPIILLVKQPKKQNIIKRFFKYLIGK